MPRQKVFRRKSVGVFKKVIELRKKEYSYTEIRKETGLAKSTIQNWLTHAGLTLTRDHFEIQAKKRMKNYKIGIIAAQITRSRRRNLEIQNFIQDVKHYFNDPFFVAGIMLYEAEGTKGDANGFSNSDFRLVSVYINFLEKYFALNRNKNFSFRVYIHQTRKKDLKRIIGFWAKKLSISSQNIKVSWKHNVVTERRFNKDYVGQLDVRIRGFRNLSRKLLAVSGIILKKYQDR